MPTLKEQLYGDCIFCQLIQGSASKEEQIYFYERIYHENEHWICVLDMQPKTRGHTVLICKDRESSHTLEANEEIYSALQRAINVSQGKLKNCLKEWKKFTLHSLNELGRKEKDGRPGHLHFHLIPVYEFTDSDLVEWHRLRPDEKSPEQGFWYFGYKEHESYLRQRDPQTEAKIKKEIRELEKYLKKGEIDV